MSNPFETAQMAAGYASYRPPIHPRVVGRAYRSLAMSVAARSALDVGCGAGVSTRALDGFAEHRIGMEPACTIFSQE